VRLEEKWAVGLDDLLEFLAYLDYLRRLCHDMLLLVLRLFKLICRLLDFLFLLLFLSLLPKSLILFKNLDEYKKHTLAQIFGIQQQSFFVLEPRNFHDGVWSFDIRVAQIFGDLCGHLLTNILFEVLGQHFLHHVVGNVFLLLDFVVGVTSDN
jgi:hypothetical protein